MINILPNELGQHLRAQEMLLRRRPFLCRNKVLFILEVVRHPESWTLP